MLAWNKTIVHDKSHLVDVLYCPDENITICFINYYIHYFYYLSICYDLTKLSVRVCVIYMLYIYVRVKFYVSLIEMLVLFQLQIFSFHSEYDE